MTAVRSSAFLALLWLVPLAAEDRDARRIQDRFVAPCCWQESVAVHGSEVASQMRAEIVRMVAEGENEDQIVDVYVARYGERILREPRGYKLFWLTLIPVLLITVAAAWLFGYIRRHRQSPTSIQPHVADLPTLPDVDLD